MEWCAVTVKCVTASGSGICAKVLPCESLAGSKPLQAGAAARQRVPCVICPVYSVTGTIAIQGSTFGLLIGQAGGCSQPQ